ncbi:MAG: hypothetical protein IJ829_06300 [Kiritimatiellae bacterium]|nr:hypothetical protein [Kiritimatiellia bacterium]
MKAASRRHSRLFLLLVGGVALCCGLLAWRIHSRAALADGFVWEYLGDNNSRIVSRGETVVGPGGIELEDRGDCIVGMCLDDNFRTFWFMIDKKARTVAKGDSIHDLQKNPRVPDAKPRSPRRLMTFQSWQKTRR